MVGSFIVEFSPIYTSAMYFVTLMWTLWVYLYMMGEVNISAELKLDYVTITVWRKLNGIMRANYLKW